MDIIGLLILAGELSGNRPGKECPICGEVVRTKALICRFCGYVFPPPPPPPEPEPRRPRRKREGPDPLRFFSPLKDCPECGEANRRNRTVCRACGYYFQEN